MHAVVNSLRILQCLKCGRQTPGLDTKYEDITVWEQG